MQNLKKSLVFIAALGSMQQLSPMSGFTGMQQISPSLGQGTSTYSPVMNITGIGRYVDQTGTYNSQPNVNQAVLGKDSKYIFTNVIPQYSGSVNLTNLPKHAVHFATIDAVNPKWSGSGKIGSQYKHIKLWGVLSTKIGSEPEDKITPTKPSITYLGENGAGTQTRQTITGYKKGQTGVYYMAGPKKGTAVLHAKDKKPIEYSHVMPVHQKHHGTLVSRPKNAPKDAVKFAYYEPETTTQGGVGKPSTRTILFGVPVAAL